MYVIFVCWMGFPLHSQQLTVANRLPKSLRTSFENRRPSKVVHLASMMVFPLLSQQLNVGNRSTDHVNVWTPLKMVITCVRRQCIPTYQFICANEKFTVFFYYGFTNLFVPTTRARSPKWNISLWCSGDC